MNLHLDKNAFRVLIEQIHDRTGYRADVLEKDYYVVLVLKELSELQQTGLPAYFKGGTALYKALKTTNRFSEDIDLSVDTRGCSRTQNDKRLAHAAKQYKTLPRAVDAGRTNRSEVISVYTYTPIVSYDKDDALQRFGRLKVEATSFTISEPTASLEVSPMIYDLATAEQQKILSGTYDVKPFCVKTITMERIFIDKIFAAEAYVRRAENPSKAFEAAKHIYDLAVIAEQERIKTLLSDENALFHLLQIRMEEEKSRLDGIPGIGTDEFIFFHEAAENVYVRRAYDIMQNQYVFRACDRISFDTAAARLTTIADRLEYNPAWLCFDSLGLSDQMRSKPRGQKKRTDSLER